MLIGVRSVNGLNPALGYSAGFMTSVLTLTSSVVPSGTARTTSSVPILPEAPGLLSMKTGRFKRSDSAGAICLATRSMPVPSVKGTTRRIGVCVA